MTPARDDIPDVFALVQRLLPGVALTPGQLTQVRAANTKLQGEIALLIREARADGRSWTWPSAAEQARLQAMLVRELHDMLTEAQRPGFEQRVALLES
jgi:hypothetical protein